MGEVDRELGRLAIARGLVTDVEVQECLQVAAASAPPMNLWQVFLLRGVASSHQVQDLLKEVGATVDMPSVPRAGLSPGRSFARYEILSEIGRGGMGAVYKALDTGLDRIVALKILSDRMIATEEDLHRFQRESKLAARVRHPNLVPVYEAGIHEGVPYYTMEYVEGRSFDEVLVDEFAGTFKAEAPRLTRDDKVRIMIRVAEAVHALHRAGIIHRDLKPANIVLDAQNEPHVMDFGLAKELESVTFLTSTGTAMGTPYYMPPEQARGKIRELDARSDVYALGAVAYHAVTLQLPFMEATAAVVLRKVIEDEPTAPRKIDPEIEKPLERIILKAMSKRREDRYPSAADLARDLERHLLGQPVAARGPSPWRRLLAWIGRHPTLSASMGVAVLLLAGFGLFLELRPGSLSVKTDPPGAEIWIDGVRTGRSTPVDGLSLARGRHVIRLTRPGFRAVTIPLDLAAGEEQVRFERLEVRSGRMTISTSPAPAEVRLDGPQSLVLQSPVDLVALPEGEYRAEFFRPQHRLARRRVTVDDRGDVREKVELAEALVWRARVGESVYTDPVIADVDGDRVPDVVVASKEGKVVAIGGKDGRPLWTHETRKLGPGQPVVFDADRDGQPDVLVPVAASGFLCLRGRDGAARYYVETGTRMFLAGRLPDADGDGYPDVVAAGWDGQLSCHSGRALLSLKPGQLWSVPLGARPVGAPWVGGAGIVAVTEARRVVRAGLDGQVAGAFDVPSPVADWTMDASESHLVIAGGGEVALWTLAGGEAKWTRPLGAIPTAVAAAREILVSTEEGLLVAVRADGTEAWRYRADQSICGRAAWADLDGDGTAEILVGSDDRRLHVLDGAGRLRWYYVGSDSVTGGPAVADFTADGIPEAVFATRDGRVVAAGMWSR